MGRDRDRAALEGLRSRAQPRGEIDEIRRDHVPGPGRRQILGLTGTELAPRHEAGAHPDALRRREIRIMRGDQHDPAGRQPCTSAFLSCTFMQYFINSLLYCLHFTI